MTTGNDKPCVNIISVSGLERLPSPIPVSSFTKISNNLPLRARSTSGGWSYVKPLPHWNGTVTGIAVTEDLEDEHQTGVSDSLYLDGAKRTKRLLNAPKQPNIIQTVARVFI